MLKMCQHVLAIKYIECFTLAEIEARESTICPFLSCVYLLVFLDGSFTGFLGKEAALLCLKGFWIVDLLLELLCCP